MNELLKDYEPVKMSGGTGKKTPIVEITKSGDGVYLKGVLLSKRSQKDADGKDRLVATFKLVETTANLIKKGANGYAPTQDVKPGEEVTVFGPPASLERALNTIDADGTQEVLIVYEGKKKVKLNSGKSVNMHTFKVGKRVVTTQMKSEEIPD